MNLSSVLVWVCALVVVFLSHGLGWKAGFQEGERLARVQFLVPSESDVLRSMFAPTLAPMPVFPPSPDLVHQSAEFQPALKEEK